MGTGKAATVVLFITHYWDDACAAQIAKLQRELGADYDVKVAGFIPARLARPAMPRNILAYFYNEDDLARVAPDNDKAERWHFFVLLRFFKDFPDYRHYWIIENDVRYTGDWGALFATLNDPRVAFYGTGLGRRKHFPEWAHWQNFSTGTDDVAPADFVKCFGPLQRLSAAALSAVQVAIDHGWNGHYEAVWPTAIAHAGMRLEEIGGRGKFTPRARRGKHYLQTARDAFLSPGTFVFRPTLLEHEVKPGQPLLWHPVKPANEQMRQVARATPEPGYWARLWQRLRR